MDPVLARLHALASSSDRDAEVDVIQMDLRKPDWINNTGRRGTVAAAVAVQVLHYFPRDRFTQVLREIREILTPNGVLFHVDVVPHGPTGVATPLTARGVDEPLSAHDPWTRWWASAQACPALESAFEQRSWDGEPDCWSAEFHPDEGEFHRRLRTAGFRDVAVIARIGSAALTVAGVI